MLFIDIKNTFFFFPKWIWKLKIMKTLVHMYIKVTWPQLLLFSVMIIIIINIINSNSTFLPDVL